MRHLAIVILGVLSPTVAFGEELPGLTEAARSILGPDQGVYVEATDGTILFAQVADRPVHPASVSKVPTTLALLRKFGPAHRFITTFAATGRVLDGTLYGDLLVEGDNDPSLVDEDALLVAERLKEIGIQRVAGTLQPRGTLTFDWQSGDDGMLLLKALSGQTPAAAWAAVRSLEASAQNEPDSSPDANRAPPVQSGIRFVSAAAPPAGGIPGPEVAGYLNHRPLVIHRSQPLLSLIKALNDYSNNIFKPFADSAGGAAAVEALARGAVPASMRSEIILGDGAGTDSRNRLSPRAAVKLLRALEQELARTGHGLVEILPVAGVDEGTLRHRLSDPGEAGRVVGKTGTFGDYGASALIGAIATTDRGTVYFAILNHGVPVPRARSHQDEFVRALLMRLHSVPWDYQRDERPAVARTEALIVPR